MRYLASFIMLLSTICFAEDRKPDVTSIPADLSDYYYFESSTGNWLWKDDYQKVGLRYVKKAKKVKGIVIIGKMSLRYLSE